jgi:iron complex outermembrane receptor protein
MRTVSASTLLAAAAAASAQQTAAPPPSPAPPAEPAAQQPPSAAAPAAKTPPAARGTASELMLFEDIPVVVTASRAAQPLTLSPVPVSILTADDIHYGGLTNIADALRFVPGVDVLRTDRNRYGVGVRGLNHWAAERTLTLLDGRDTELPLLGAPDYLSLPIFMEDIERVEVVRGPGGAAWGANALNGVINIITKDPEKTQGFLAQSRINQFGETSSEFRWGASSGDLSWRISAGYREHKSSEDTIDNDTFVSRDFNRQVIIDSKAVYKLSTSDKISFGTSFSGADRADTIIGNLTESDERLDDARAFARWDHSFSGGGSAYIQWTGLYDDRDQPDHSHPISYATNLDAQLSLAKAGAHSISFGGNIRYAQIDLPQDVSTGIIFADGDDYREYWIGAFVQDRIEITSRLAVEAQLRIDYDSGSNTHADWSGRLALLYGLDERQHHVVRAAIARAFRTVGPEFRNGSFSSFIFSSIPNTSIANEGVWSVEGGYNGRLSETTTLRVDGYYQRYSDLVGLYPLSATPPYTEIVLNGTGAEGYGLETELAFKGDMGQLSFWYAYHAFAGLATDANFRANTPPTHNVGANGRLFLSDGLTFNANYRFADANAFVGTAGYVLPVHPSHRADFTITKSFANGNGELTLGVEDAFNTTVGAGQEIFTGATRLPGRTFFARFQLKF